MGSSSSMHKENEIGPILDGRTCRDMVIHWNTEPPICYIRIKSFKIHIKYSHPVSQSFWMDADWGEIWTSQNSIVLSWRTFWWMLLKKKYRKHVFFVVTPSRSPLFVKCCVQAPGKNILFIGHSEILSGSFIHFSACDSQSDFTCRQFPSVAVVKIWGKSILTNCFCQKTSTTRAYTHIHQNKLKKSMSVDFQEPPTASEHALNEWSERLSWENTQLRVVSTACRW